MLATSDPALRLLLATLRWPRDRRAVQDAIADQLDWERFIALADRHRVAPLALSSLASAQSRVPKPLARQIGETARRALFSEMRFASEVARLRELLRLEGIEPVLLKGTGLSLRAFGELGLRTYRDLDFLIQPASLAAARTRLEADGYELLEPSIMASSGPEFDAWRKQHKDAVFRNRQSGILLELHWRLFDNCRIMPVDRLPQPVALDLAPLDSIMVLPIETELHYLSIHGALHGWSRLRWLADINALVCATPIQFLTLDAALQPAAAQALILCRDLLGAVLPRRLNEALAKSIRGNWLAKLAWSEIQRSGTDELESVPFGSTLKNASHYALLDDPGSIFEELRFDLFAQPRLNMVARRRGGRIGDWMARHLLSR